MDVNYCAIYEPLYAAEDVMYTLLKLDEHYTPFIYKKSYTTAIQLSLRNESPETSVNQGFRGLFMPADNRFVEVQ
jgi:hypothetical protein